MMTMKSMVGRCELLQRGYTAHRDYSSCLVCVSPSSKGPRVLDSILRQRDPPRDRLGIAERRRREEGKRGGERRREEGREGKKRREEEGER